MFVPFVYDFLQHTSSASQGKGPGTHPPQTWFVMHTRWHLMQVGGHTSQVRRTQVCVSGLGQSFIICSVQLTSQPTAVRGPQAFATTLDRKTSRKANSTMWITEESVA